jgi:hypothetical protein
MAGSHAPHDVSPIALTGDPEMGHLVGKTHSLTIPIIV